MALPQVWIGFDLWLDFYCNSHKMQKGCIQKKKRLDVNKTFDIYFFLLFY